MHIVKARGSDIVYIVQALVPYMQYKQAYSKVMKELFEEENSKDVVITHLNLSQR
jgi:hypothetical protein